MVPEQVLLPDEEIEQLFIEVVEGTLEGGVATLSQLHGCPLENHIDALHQVLWLALHERKQFLDNLQVLLEICCPHGSGSFQAKDLLAMVFCRGQVLRFNVIEDPLGLAVHCCSPLLVARVDGVLIRFFRRRHRGG